MSNDKPRRMFAGAKQTETRSVAGFLLAAGTLGLFMLASCVPPATPGRPSDPANSTSQPANKIATGPAVAISAGQPTVGPAARLVDEKAVLELKSEQVVRWLRGLHTMRLTPDGKTLVYLRIDEIKGKSAIRLVLRNIASGKDIVVESLPCISDQLMVRMMTSNILDSYGRAVFGVALEINGGRTMWLTSIDLGTGRLDSHDFGDNALMPQFASAAGEPKQPFMHLLMFRVKAPNADGESRECLCTATFDPMVVQGSDAPRITNLKDLSIVGQMSSPSSAADLIAVFVAPEGRATSRPAPKLVLYDYKADKAVAELAINPQNRKLADYPPQWTADGRYLYYLDVRLDESGEKERAVNVTRVYDIKAGREIQTITDATPIAAGPDGTMVLQVRQKDLTLASAVHNARTNTISMLGDSGIGVINVSNQTVIYRKIVESDDGEDDQAKVTIYTAKIVLP